MDVKFCSLVSFIRLQNKQVSALDADFRIRITSDRMASPSDAGVMTAISATVSTNTVTRLWLPPAIILPGGGANSSVAATMLNVDSDDYTVDMLVYLFNIRVRELTAMGPLLWARGTT